MPYSRRPSRSPRSRTTLVLLLLTAVSLLVLDLPGTGVLRPVRTGLSTVFSPFRAAGNAVFEPISNGWKGAFGYGDLEDENAELRRDLEEIEGQDAEIARLRQDNADLREAAGITVAETPTKTARVVNGPLTSFEQTVEINAGSDGGVKKGMAVITGGGLYGRVAKTKSGSSTVELLTDANVNIGVATKDGDTAIAHGQGRDEPLRIEGIEDSTRIRVGDYIYTSGVDRSAFPGELYIGKVSKVGKSEGGLARVIEVEPSADFKSRYVKVVLREAPK